MRAALLHAEDELRVAAYEALCCTLQTTALPSEAECALLELFWRHSAKSDSSDYRHNVRAASKRLLWRLRSRLRRTWPVGRQRRWRSGWSSRSGSPNTGNLLRSSLYEAWGLNARTTGS